MGGQGRTQRLLGIYAVTPWCGDGAPSMTDIELVTTDGKGVGMGRIGLGCPRPLAW